ncbi:hypothetical protein [Noviherbaspirillum pedocola]|uniref:Uncharacterized protein n=1 Tax=Noviherbaspirillum pedocola TaxID=2801341 RepID=A0A934SQC0_9BURK|nr:hypothetical protein [Noviherbaspirillum pedocola]MBK4734791.1 hypothetical protein [Noviherbaspirillum pedocola]
MQVDGAPVSEPRHGLKRKWTESIDPGQSSAATTDEPRFKRSRTGSASPEAAAPIFQDFHVVDDADFIELIRKHGGRPVNEQGETVRLELPKAGNLEFRVTLACMKLERMLSNINLPGSEEFIPNAFMEFVDSLEVASYANEAALVRRLLATGMGKRPAKCSSRYSAKPVPGARTMPLPVCARPARIRRVPSRYRLRSRLRPLRSSCRHPIGHPWFDVR